MKKIQTINDCIKRLNAILYNFFVTDLIMHKHGVMYESEGYKKRTFKRLQHLFKKVEKIVANQNKNNILEVLQKKEEEYLKQLKVKIEKAKKKNEERIYIPEEDTLVEVRVADWMIWRDIKAMLEGKKNAEKTVADIFELYSYIMEKKFEYCRKNLQNYGYIPRKEKKVQYLKRK